MDPKVTLKKAVDLVLQSEVVKRQQITSNNATTTLDIDTAVVQDRRIHKRNAKNNVWSISRNDCKASRPPSQMFPLQGILLDVVLTAVFLRNPSEQR